MNPGATQEAREEINEHHPAPTDTNTNTNTNANTNTFALLGSRIIQSPKMVF